MTTTDVRHAFTRATSAARAAGLDPSTWHLVEGSSTYGRAFRLVAVDQGNGAQGTPRGLWSTHLGMTRREAMATLDGMRCAWLSVSDRVA